MGMPCSCPTYWSLNDIQTRITRRFTTRKVRVFTPVRSQRNGNAVQLSHLLVSQRHSNKNHQAFYDTESTSIHAGQEPEKWECRAVVPLIGLSTTFKQESPGVLRHGKYEYSRRSGAREMGMPCSCPTYWSLNDIQTRITR